MKRILYSCVSLFTATLCANAQNLTQQMYNLYEGHVKTLVQKIEGTPGEVITQFDENGRVLSTEQGDMKLNYLWNDDSSCIELRGYTNGKLQGSQMLYVSEMNALKYRYEVGGISFTIDFKTNGAVSKQTVSMNGQTQTTFFYFKSMEDTLPYKMVMSMGGQSMSAMIEIREVDSYGNPICLSQTANGQTMISTNEITYY